MLCPPFAPAAYFSQASADIHPLKHSLPPQRSP